MGWGMLLSDFSSPLTSDPSGVLWAFAPTHTHLFPPPSSPAVSTLTPYSPLATPEPEQSFKVDYDLLE